MAFKKKDAATLPENQDVPETDPVDSPETEDNDEPVAVSEQFDRVLSKSAKTTLTNRAKELVQQELMKKERDDFLKSEMDRLRIEAGVSKPSSLGGIQDELVEIVLDLGYEGQAFIQLNQPHGPRYYHGQKYTVPRHIASVLNEIAFAGSNLSKEVKGESVFRNRQYGTVLSAVSGRKDTGKALLN